MTKRALAKSFVVGPPRAVSTRTRLFPSDVDETVLREVGEHLGSLLRSDLAARCRLGTGYKHLGRAKRKRSLTSRCSSRWAGAITRVVGDMWERELLNLEDLEVRDRREIAVLDRRRRRKRQGVGQRNDQGGEKGKAWGNETIRVAPHRNGEYTVTIRLPAPLAHLSNTPGRTPTYRLSAPAKWHHLAGEWKAQASADRAVGYAINYNAGRERWYITASWSQPPKENPTVADAARSGRCLAIDLNSGHIDARILDVHGNPIGRPVRETIPERGSSAHRLGALREAVSRLVKRAQRQGVTVIAIEKLNFADLHTRQKGRRGKAGKTTRRKVCGIPTAKFVHTIASAAYRHDMTVIAVDPAYTSIWGARYWKKPLDRSRRQRGDRHQAAAVIIGRRSQGHSAKRKSSQRPCRPEDRPGKATVQPIANTTGMAHTTGNDRRERSHVGVTTVGAEP